MPPIRAPGEQAKGLAAAVTAYSLWGLFPAYWKLLSQVPAYEMLAHRIVWSAALLVALALARGRLGGLVAVLRDRRRLAALAASASLITVNFFVFIWAVTHGRVTEVSLGYYINPILNVLLGFLVLRERMTRLQAVAVALATLGVVNLAVAQGAAPWVSLALAFAFGLYGLVRKLAPVEAQTGLSVEMLLLTAPALTFLVLFREPAMGALTTGGLGQGILVLASGPVTATPLFLFAMGARQLPLGVLGMLQYLAPTLQLALAVLAYGEPFTPAHGLTFACSWIAMVLYVREAWRLGRVNAAAQRHGRPIPPSPGPPGPGGPPGSSPGTPFPAQSKALDQSRS
ncbi:MAG TPA: EamA family transporter RarD [Polyangiaceae bacterium LLY-WYZ-14_1]|nr:EamA family transporter RarD [Polyangiaceae bacterium LLY-WYZ-14_1]